MQGQQQNYSNQNSDLHIQHNTGGLRNVSQLKMSQNNFFES
jgi:hypothetical protein